MGECGSKEAAPEGSLKEKEQQKQSTAPKKTGRTQTSPVLLDLGEDRCNLIFSLLSARHLLGLRQTCNTARRISDRLPVWTEMLEDMNKMNRYNVSRFGKENKPFVWLPEAERDENYQRRSDALPDWSKNDPRIRKSWASLTSFGKFAELYAFSRETVKRIQTHLPLVDYLPLYDGIPWPGCGIPSIEGVSPSVALTVRRISDVYHGKFSNEHYKISARFQVFFRLAQLNTAMEDLRRESGPCWYRESGSANSDVVIEESNWTSLRKAMNRFYCCDEGQQHRWSGKRWGTHHHLCNLGRRRAASRRLMIFLGIHMCERIEVLGQARDILDLIIANLEDMDWLYSQYHEDSQSYSGDSWSEDEDEEEWFHECVFDSEEEGHA